MYIYVCVSCVIMRSVRRGLIIVGLLVVNCRARRWPTSSARRTASAPSLASGLSGELKTSRPSLRLSLGAAAHLGSPQASPRAHGVRTSPGSSLGLDRPISECQLAPRCPPAAEGATVHGCSLRCAQGCSLRCAQGCSLRCTRLQAAGAGAAAVAAHFRLGLRLLRLSRGVNSLDGAVSRWRFTLARQSPHQIRRLHRVLGWVGRGALFLPRVAHRQRADPSELREELRPLRVELLAARLSGS